MKSDIKMVRRDIETNWGEVETVIFQSRHICPPHRPPPSSSLLNNHRKQKGALTQTPQEYPLYHQIKSIENILSKHLS